jgi:glycosyltransferase involved in cell wall biosynthesis
MTLKELTSHFDDVENENDVLQKIQTLSQEFPTERLKFYKYLFSILKNSYVEIAVHYGKLYYEQNPTDLKFRKVLFNRLVQIRDQKELEAILLHNSIYSVEKFHQETYQQDFTLVAEHFSEPFIKKFLGAYLAKFTDETTPILKIAFSILKDSHTSLAIDYGKAYIAMNPADSKFAKILIKRLKLLGLDLDTTPVAKIVSEHCDDSTFHTIVLHDALNKELKTLELLYQKKEPHSIKTFIEKLKQQFDASHHAKLYKALHQFYKEKEYRTSEAYALHSLALDDNTTVRRSLYDLHIFHGHITKAVESIPKDHTNPLLVRKRETGKSFLALLKQGFDLPIQQRPQGYAPIEKKVFYLLHNRLPYNSGGYATRSHGLLTNVATFGWEMHGVSRLGYPWDKMPQKLSEATDSIDGITYHRLFKEEIGLGKLPLKEYLEAYASELLEFAKKEKPSMIHAASNYMNGVVGNWVAKSLGIPSVYEVRGLWEITRISRQPEWKDTEYYNLMAQMEAEAAKGADAVLTLTEALKEEMISRGVRAEKISILPNGVTSHRFQPLKRDKALQKALNVKGKTVIGYIGSVVAYEGLEYVVDAVALLIERGLHNIAVLVVGDGAVLEAIQTRVASQNIEAYFIFTGRIPHDEVEKYYSLVDIVPIARKGQPVCEMVSPLKPFEAMAMGKVVIASNVAALQEIITHGKNGLLFQKDDVVDLADNLETLIQKPKLRKTIGKQAREWVVKKRDWRVISEHLHTVYQDLHKV